MPAASAESVRNAAYSLAADRGERAVGWVRRNWSVVLLLLAAAGPVWLIWVSVVRPVLYRKVVLFTSADREGGSWKYGQTIQSHFAKNPGWLPVRYEIELRESKGFADNRVKVAEADPDELVLGFDHDGFQHAGKVKVLVPLREVYLFMVARKADVVAWRGRNKDTKGPAGGPTFKELRDWCEEQRTARELRSAAVTDLLVSSGLAPAADLAQAAGRRPFRCYLGPDGSGTRQMALEVLNHYQFHTRKGGIAAVDAGDLMSWDVAYSRLRQHELDVVFDAADPKADRVAQLAASGEFALVGLDGLSAPAHPPAPAGSPTLPPSPPFFVGGKREGLVRAVVGANSFGDGTGFCEGGVETIASQRLIVCQKSLPAYHAHHLAEGIQEALPEHLPPDWRPATAGAVEGRPKLSIEVHAGGEDARHGRQPLLVRLLVSYWAYLASTLFGFLGFVLTRERVVRWLSQAGSPPVVTVVAPLRRRQTVGRTARAAAVYVHDEAHPPEALTVTAASSDPDVVPDSALRVGGAGSVRRVRVWGAGLKAAGRAIITVTARTPDGRSAEVSLPIRVVRPSSGSPPPPRAGASRGVPAGAADPTPARNVEVVDQAAQIAHLRQQVQGLAEDAAAGVRPRPPADRADLVARYHRLRATLREYRDSLTLAADLRDEVRAMLARLEVVAGQLRAERPARRDGRPRAAPPPPASG